MVGAIGPVGGGFYVSLNMFSVFLLLLFVLFSIFWVVSLSFRLCGDLGIVGNGAFDSIMTHLNHFNFHLEISPFLFLVYSVLGTSRSVCSTCFSCFTHCECDIEIIPLLFCCLFSIVGRGTGLDHLRGAGLRLGKRKTPQPQSRPGAND